MSIIRLATLNLPQNHPPSYHRLNLDTIMANHPEAVPFHILMDPFQKDFQDNILIEIAIYVMKHAKGDFKPEDVTLKINTQRRLYVAWLPQALVDLLTAMPAPKKFPSHLGTNATFLFLAWTPEPVRLWMTLTQPESAPSLPTTVLKITLNDILNKNGLAIRELKPNLNKNSDAKCPNGIYYVSLTFDKNWPHDTESTLEDLKHVTIKGAHWKVELSNTVTHKLDLCIECYCPLPKDHPAVLNKPEFLEQRTDEDVTISDARKRAYINAAMHQNCRKKPPPKRGASSSNAIDTFKAMLAKRNKEEE